MRFCEINYVNAKRHTKLKHINSCCFALSCVIYLSPTAAVNIFLSRCLVPHRIVVCRIGCRIALSLIWSFRVALEITHDRPPPKKKRKNNTHKHTKYQQKENITKTNKQKTKMALRYCVEKPMVTCFSTTGGCLGWHETKLVNLIYSSDLLNDLPGSLRHSYTCWRYIINPSKYGFGQYSITKDS